MSEPDSATGSARGRWLAALIFAGLFAVLIAVLATSSQGDDNRVASPLIGELVPAIEGDLLLGQAFSTATGAANGATATAFNIDSLGGRWVLVNFFASWCVPCRQEHPELVAWSQDHRFDGQVVSIPFGDTDEGAVAFFEEFGADSGLQPWPVLKDTDARWAVAFGVLRPPESFLVAPNGTVVARWQGRITANEVDQVIAAATGA